MTEQTDAAEVEALADEILAKADHAFPWPGELDELIADDIAKALIASDWLAAREAAARVEALREAAKDCHDEARWCEEQEMRGKPQNAVDRVLVLEKVFRQRSRAIARTDGAGS
jgi:hypothetical protein